MAQRIDHAPNAMLLLNRRAVPFAVSGFEANRYLIALKAKRPGLSFAVSQNPPFQRKRYAHCASVLGGVAPKKAGGLFLELPSSPISPENLWTALPVRVVFHEDSELKIFNKKRS
jgi:hypothetical protein